MKTRFEHYSLFGEAWWLDAAAGPGNWGDVRIESSGQLEARLPFVLTTRCGIRNIGSPALTPFLGPWFAHREEKYSSCLARQKDLTYELIAKLPRHHRFAQRFHPAVTNWLPWYWLGYRQTTRYTYQLQLNDIDGIWTSMQSNIRGHIRKAKERYALQVRDDCGADALHRICQLTFDRVGRAGLSISLIRRIVNAAETRATGKTLFAVDEQQRIHASVFIVWDERATFLLLGGGDPELRHSGAHSLLIWEAIQHAAGVSKVFDFEGSMLEPVERFFRAFDARQVPCHYVVGGGRLVQAAEFWRDGLGSLIRGRQRMSAIGF